MWEWSLEVCVSDCGLDNVVSSLEFMEGIYNDWLVSCIGIWVMDPIVQLRKSY